MSLKNRLLDIAKPKVKRVIQSFRPYPDINHLLHDLRGQKINALPERIKRLVSVGCAGTWYFKWVEEMYGPLETHTGVEFYTAKPDDLPAGVNWIANTAGHMPEVGDSSADAIFSGQNIEHLWPEEVCGFFQESYRILDDNGLLIIDSPNRNITAKLNWSHPEHTVEMTIDEIRRLCELAGFEVTKCAGLWLVEDPDSGKLLRFDQQKRWGKLSLEKRSKLAENLPESSFIWWLEARKTQRQPNMKELTQEINTIFARAWPERCQRMQQLVGESDGLWFDSKQYAGVLMYGPYIPLRAGNYRITFHFSCGIENMTEDQILANCDVLSASSSDPLCQIQIVNPDYDAQGYFDAVLNFSLKETTFGMQFRVIAQQNIALRVSRQVDIQDTDEYPQILTNKG